MEISLKKASPEDAELIHSMQIIAFRPLLEKYQDYDYSPAMETLERTKYRISLPAADHWLILLNDHPVGAIGIGRYDGYCKLKRLFILPEYQNHGYAQQGVRLAEAQYPSGIRWELDTILQEEKLCHLYEKLGYRKTEKIKPIKEGMDLIFFEK